MAHPELLDNQQIADLLAEHPNWQHKENTIVREISAANFSAAIGIVNAIAVLAEANDHHPDILIYGWNKVRITLSTHDKCGLTKNDFDLAKKIDDLNF